MNTQAHNSSYYRHIQQFAEQFRIEQANLAQWVILSLSPVEDSKDSLTMDWANGKFGKSQINYLVPAVSYKSIAIPLLWTLP